MLLNQSPENDVHPKKELAVSIVQEFKQFAVKGNALDLAVGVIIGAAFGKIVTVLVDRIIMPPIGMLVGGMDFTDLRIVMQEAAADGKGEVSIGYGELIQTGLNFFIVAVAVFALVKAINSLKKAEEAKPAAPAPTPDDVILLREIRDLLKK